MTSINELPTEILMKTLQYLEPLQMIRCRRVSAWWKAVVDSLTNEDFWQKLCELHHPTICREARYKCNPSMTWQELYKSLHLWSKPEKVNKEYWMQIGNYVENDKKVLGVSAIYGNLCIHDYNKILYYNLEGRVTFQFEFNVVHDNFGWNYKKSSETDNVFIVLLNKGEDSKLIIIKKTNGIPDFLDRKVLTSPKICNYVIVGEDVYYWTFQTAQGIKIFKCVANDNYKINYIGPVRPFIEGFTCVNNTLNIILSNYDLYVVEGNQLVFKENLRNKTPIYIIITYKCQLKYVEVFPAEQKNYRITAFYVYGGVTFLGGDDGILRLYNTEKLLADQNTKSIRRFDIISRLELINTYDTLICGIDVVEKENGHIVFVSIYNKGAFTIELNHT